MKHRHTSATARPCPSAESKPKLAELPKLTALELHRIAPMDEAEHLSSLSEDTLSRDFSEYIIKLSRRRRGMRVGHCLQIAGRKV
jgi:hypothetical protein